MAQFRTMILTDRGRNLLAKIVAGSSGVAFTKVGLSSQAYADNAIPALTALSNVKQTVQVSRVTKLNTAAVEIEAAIDNLNVTQGYTLASIGLYATDPDLGEILYGVSGSDVAGYVPAYNGVTVSGIYVNLTTSVNNASNVNLQVNPAATATIADIQALQEEISDLQAFIGYTDDTIFGVEVDLANKTFTRLAGAVGKTPGTPFDSIRAFGGRRRCDLTNDGVVVAYYGDPAYTETGKLTQSVDLNPDDAEEADPNLQFAAGTIVQTMVEQPRFYYKVVPLLLEKIADGDGWHMRKARYYVSDTPHTGFKLHPAFIVNGVEKDKIYLSAYEASLYDASAGAYILDDAQVADFSADMLASIANAKPISGLTQNLTRANTRALAHNRGAGWEQMYCATASATQMLMLIEYATLNMQTAIGSGAVNKADDGASNMEEPSGATTNLGNASGTAVNTNGIQFVTYRGEENLWGNIWGWVDGMNINANGIHKLYVADHDFADRKMDGHYMDTGLTLAKANGYISAFGYNEPFDWLFVTTEVAGNSSVPAGDYFYQNYTYADVMVARLGGDWHGGSTAGPFSWSVNHPPAVRSRAAGGRPVYIPQA